MQISWPLHRSGNIAGITNGFATDSGALVAISRRQRTVMIATGEKKRPGRLPSSICITAERNFLPEATITSADKVSIHGFQLRESITASPFNLTSQVPRTTFRGPFIRQTLRELCTLDRKTRWQRMGVRVEQMGRPSRGGETNSGGEAGRR